MSIRKNAVNKLIVSDGKRKNPKEKFDIIRLDVQLPEYGWLRINKKDSDGWLLKKTIDSNSALLCSFGHDQ